MSVLREAIGHFRGVSERAARFMAVGREADNIPCPRVACLLGETLHIVSKITVNNKDVCLIYGFCQDTEYGV